MPVFRATLHEHTEFHAGFRKERGRRATVMLAPDLSAEQRKSVKAFDLGRWMPILLSSRSADTPDSDEQPSA